MEHHRPTTPPRPGFEPKTHEKVFGLDVTMNDHLVMKVLERRRQVRHHPSGHQLRVLRVGGDGVEEIPAFHVFRHLRTKEGFKHKGPIL